MGRHADEKRGRGLAGWIIAAAISVVVVVIATVGYIVVVVQAPEDGLCSSATSLAIAAGPSATPAIKDAAAAYNDRAPVVRSSCITASVTAVSDDAALKGLTDGWPSTGGPAPGLWIPDNTASLAALDAASPKTAAGHSTDALAWSPLVLAMHQSDADAASSLSWSDVAAASATGDPAQLSGSGTLLLAMPPIATAPTTGYLVQALLVASAAPASLDADTVMGNSEMVASLAQAYDGDAETTRDALGELAGRADGGASAVPVVEADLVRFDRHTAGDRLTAVYLKGSTVGNALIAAPISASWTDRTTTAAASDFQAFLADPAGQQILADHGWRTRSAEPSTPISAVDTTRDVTMIPSAGPAVNNAIAVALGQQAPPESTATSSSAPATSTSEPPPPTTPTTPTAPTTTSPPTTSESIPDVSDAAARGPVLTLIIDTSADMSTEVEGMSLLGWVKKAVVELSDGSVTDQVGLWAYSDALIYPPSGFPRLVATGPLSETVTITPEGGGEGATVEKPRLEAIDEAVAGLTAQGERWAYGALMEALTKVPDAAVDGRASRVILFTSGTDETPGTPRRMVIDAVEQVAGSVRVDVVGLGDAVPVDAYSDIASASNGGEYIPAPDPKQLGQQLTDLLTLGD